MKPTKTADEKLLATEEKPLDEQELEQVVGGRNVKNFDKPVRDYVAVTITTTTPK